MSASVQGISSADSPLPGTMRQRDGILEPKKVVHFKGEQPKFYPHTLEKELEAFGAMSDQLYVISVTGLCRTGKSFLINLMIHYLDYYCQHGTDDGWERSSHLITGVKWAKGQKQSVTQGIWMLLYPKLVHGKRLVFMDCQGTGDNDQYTPTLDKMIMFYALKLSDLTIINIRGKIEPTHLDALGVCLLTSQGKQLPTGFKDLSFLIRDWPDDDQPMPLAEMAEKSHSPDVKKSVSSILKSCRTVQSTGLPHPGRRVGKASETDGITLADVDEEEFVAACKKFFKKVLIEEPSKSTTTKEGRSFMLDFKLLGKVTVDKSTTLMDACVSSLINDAYTDALNQLEAKGVDIHENHFNTEQEMRREAAKALEEAVQNYQADPRVVEHADEERKNEDSEGLKKIAEDFIEKGAYAIREREREKELNALKEADAKREREMQELKADQKATRKRFAELEEEQKKQKKRDEEREKEFNRQKLELKIFAELEEERKKQKKRDEEREKEFSRQKLELERKMAALEQLQIEKDQAEKKKKELLNAKDDNTEDEAKREMTFGERFLDGWNHVKTGLKKMGGVAKDAVVDGAKAVEKGAVAVGTAIGEGVTKAVEAVKRCSIM